MSRVVSPGFFSRALSLVRRASAATYRILLLALLGVVYLVVIPWFALAWRLRARRLDSGGWHRRDDPGLASIERLRSLF